MSERIERPLKSILREKAEIAKDLGYSKDIIRMIKESKSEIEAENHMKDAREAI